MSLRALVPRSLVAAVAGSPRLQVGLLGAFFFFNEMGSYFTGVLACTLLVKRAGPACLPVVYIALNLAFLPITLGVMMRPPESSGRMVRGVIAAYLGLLMCGMFAAGSTSAWVLGATYIVARLGKLMITTFDAGMVAETLPLREAKAATPRLLACQSAGLVLGGLLLNPLLGVLGNTGARLVLWGAIAVGGTALGVLAACLPGNAPRVVRERKAGVRAIFADAFATLSGSPLPRLMGTIGLCTVGLRYLLEYGFAAAQARHFTSETAMAAFVGNFEAGLSITVVLVQIALVGPLMRRLKLGGMALVMPSVMTVALVAAVVSGSFAAIAGAQFCYWLCFDCFSQAVRQVLIGAVPPAQLSRVPVLMTVASIVGSMSVSLLLVPLSRLGSPVPALLTALAMAVAFWIACRPAGRIYASTLTSTLEDLDRSGRDEVLGAVGAGEEAERAARLAALLGAPDEEQRLAAVHGAVALGRRAGLPLLADRLPLEESWRVRAALLAALSPWKPAGFATQLERYLDDPEPRVRANALEGLAFFGDDPAVLAILRARVNAAVEGTAAPRQRAAAVIAAVRAGSDREMLARALDLLAAMAADADAEMRRAAAAAMGRLGYGFFVPDLVALLGDPAVPVRASALDALVELHHPAAQPALAAARATETDPDQAARIDRALAALADETTGAIVGVLDSLSGEERAQVRRVLADPRQPGDGRTRVIRAALAVEDAGLRVELVRVARMTADADLLGALERGLASDGAALDLGPLLDHLGAPGSWQRLAETPASTDSGRIPRPAHDPPPLQPPASSLQPSGPLYEALARLVGAQTHASVAAHVKSTAARLWIYTAIAESLASTGDERVREVAARAAARQRALLDHLLAVTGLAAPAPDRALRLMRAALGEDRYVSSLALEVLESWIPDRVREPVFPVLEAWADTASRRARAFQQSGLEPLAPERALALAAKEGLA